MSVLWFTAGWFAGMFFTVLVLLAGSRWAKL